VSTQVLQSAALESSAGPEGESSFDPMHHVGGCAVMTHLFSRAGREHLPPLGASDFIRHPIGSRREGSASNDRQITVTR
jgi:hypothetical protein